MHAFLVGRQFLTAMNMVLLARVTSYAGSGGAANPPPSVSRCANIPHADCQELQSGPIDFWAESERPGFSSNAVAGSVS